MIDSEQRTELMNKLKVSRYWTTNKFIKHIKEVIDLSKKNMNKSC